MKLFFESFAVAFSMYSAIPMPHVEWKKENMKYALCFFPLIGVVIGGILWLWLLFARRMGFGGTLFAAVATLLPVVLSGGIHLDGFCDTLDGIGSHQSIERKLEILKDSHVGAVALMGCGLFLVVELGLWAEFYQNPRGMVPVALGFVLSRSLSGLGVARLRCAKNSGLVHAFADAAAKDRVTGVMSVYLLLVGIAMVWAWPLPGICVLAVATVMFFCYRHMAYRQFGGITGDLAGWFLQLCEALILAIAIVVR